MPRAKFEESDDEKDQSDGEATQQRRRHAPRAPKPNAADSKLAKLRQARQEGVKHKAAESAGDELFDYVSESEYQRMVAKRQAAAFVVDDDEGLYDDHGGEIWDEEVQLKDDDEREQQRILDEQNKKHLEKQRAQKKLEKEMEFVPPALRSHAQTLAMAASLASSKTPAAGSVDIRDMFKAMKNQQGVSASNNASSLSNAADAALQEALQSVDSIAENDFNEYIPLTARPQLLTGTSTMAANGSSSYRTGPFSGSMRMSTAPPVSRSHAQQNSFANDSIDLRSSMLQRKREKKAQRDAEPRAVFPLDTETLKNAQSCPNVARQEETPKRRLVFEDDGDTAQRKKPNAATGNTETKLASKINTNGVLSPLATHSLSAVEKTRSEIAEFSANDDDYLDTGIADDDNDADNSAGSVRFGERSFHSPTAENIAHSETPAKLHDAPTTPHRPHRHVSGPGVEHKLCLNSPTYNALHPNGNILTASPTFEYAMHGGTGRLATTEKATLPPPLPHLDNENTDFGAMDLSGVFDDEEDANLSTVNNSRIINVKGVTPSQTTSANRSAAKAKRAAAAAAMANALVSSSTEFKFYLLDIVEDTTWLGQGDAKYNSGRLFLFGKCYEPTECAFVPCCVVLKNMQRQLFFKLAADVEENDAYAATETLLKTHLPSTATYTYRCTMKNYAFFEHVDVPNSDKYMEVRYSFNYPPLGVEVVLKNQKTFTHVFGATNPAFELLVVDRQIQGPSWLVVKNFLCVSAASAGTNASNIASPAANSTRGGLSSAVGGAQMTWSKVEVHVDNAASISPVPLDQKLPPPPPLTMLVLQLRTLDTEIVAAAMLIKHKFQVDSVFDPEKLLYDDHECLIAKPKSGVLPIGYEKVLAQERAKAADPNDGLKAFAFANEQQLLNKLMARYVFWDPDLLVVHDGVDYQLSTLLQRLLVHNNSQWSRLGRLRLTRRPAKTFKQQQARFDLLDTIRGRLICDIKLSAKEFVHCKSYDLANLVHEVLPPDEQRGTNPLQENMTLAYKSTGALLDSLRLLAEDAYWAIRLTVELQALPLAMEITCIAGNTLSKTLLRGRAERNEYLLLHKFAQAKYIYPDKPERHHHAGAAANAMTNRQNAARKSARKSSRKPMKTLSSVKKTEIDNNENNAEFALLDDSAFDELFGGSNSADVSIAESTTTTAQQNTANETYDVDEAVEFDAENDDENIDPNADGPKKAGGRRKPAYVGGLVLDPKPGFYDTYILLMDFNSLYPSVIQEYNICFTTVDRSAPCFSAATSTTNDDDETDGIAPLPLPGQPAGVLPQVISYLVQRRRVVKQMLKDEKISADERSQLETRQKALKLTANSMYGCLGFAGSRFYAKPLAALITQKGREALLSTKNIVDKMHLDVIYGDTDSLMINTHSVDFVASRKLGLDIKAEVNKQYKCMELDVDGLYRTMLLLKKKKYAALQAEMQKAGSPAEEAPVIKYKEEMKGLDIVRRDWCELSRRVGRKVVGMLLQPEAKRDDVVTAIHSELEQVAAQVKAGEIPLDQYIINKQLTKDPTEYGRGGDENAARGLAHVQVALRYNKTLVAAGGKPLQRGDTVQYVVCTVDADGRGPDGVPHTQRAWHYEEVLQRRHRAEQQQQQKPAPAVDAEKSADEAAENCTAAFVVPEIDINYYLSHQLHPVISRLVEPIDGTSAAIVGQCLGLDAAQIRNLTHSSHFGGGDNSERDDEAAMLGAPSDAERFASCEPFKLRCGKCCQFSTTFTLTKPSPFSTPNLSANSIEADLTLEQKCTNAMPGGTDRCGWRPLTNNFSHVKTELEKTIDVHVATWKMKTYVCSSLACGYRMQQHGRTNVTLRCRECGRDSLREEYSEMDLYLQLLFFRKMFALKDAFENLELRKPSSALVYAMEDKLFMRREKRRDLREPTVLLRQYNDLVMCVDEKLRRVHYANVSFDVFFPTTAKVKLEDEDFSDEDDLEPTENSMTVQNGTPLRKIPGGFLNTSINSSGGSRSSDVSFVPETPLRNGVYSYAHDTSMSSPLASPLSVTNSTTKKLGALSMLHSALNNSSNDNDGIGGIRSNRF